MIRLLAVKSMVGIVEEIFVKYVVKMEWIYLLVEWLINVNDMLICS